MALTPEQRKQIFQAAYRAQKAGNPLLKKTPTSPLGTPTQPATMNAETIVSTLNPNAQGDGGNGQIVNSGSTQVGDSLESVAHEN